MKRPRRALVLATGGLAMVAALALGLTQTRKPERIRPLTAEEVRTAIKGAPAPLAALNVEGNRLLPGGRPALLRRIAALRGYPVVVNVWASWCPPCRLESELFQRVAIRYGAHVAFVGVDSNDSDAAARTFLRSTPLPYPSYRDRPQAEANRLRLQGLPGTLFLDRRGRRVYLHQGQYLSLDALRRDVQRLLR